MEAKLSKAELAAIVRRQSPETRKLMRDITRIPELGLDRFLKHPEQDHLSEEHLENIAAFHFGQFVQTSYAEGYVKMSPKVPEQRMIVARPPRAQGSGVVYGNPCDGPNVRLGMSVARAALRGEELPTPDEAKIAKAKAAEAAERKGRIFSNPFKRSETVTMVPIKHN